MEKKEEKKKRIEGDVENIGKLRRKVGYFMVGNA